MTDEERDGCQEKVLFGDQPGFDEMPKEEAEWIQRFQDAHDDGVLFDDPKDFLKMAKELQLEEIDAAN